MGHVVEAFRFLSARVDDARGTAGRAGPTGGGRRLAGPGPRARGPGSSRWPPTSWRARPAATSSTPTAARAHLVAALDATGAPRRTGSSRAAGRTARARTRLSPSRSPRRPSTWPARSGGIARGHRAERGGRPPAAARPALRCWHSAGARWGAARRSSSSPSRPRPTESWEAAGARPRRTAARSTRRPGSCCSTAAGFVEVAPLAGRRRGRSPVRPGGRHALVSGIHHFVPVLHRGDAVGRHTAAPARRHAGPWVPLGDLRRHGRRRDRGRDGARPLLPRGGAGRLTSSSTSSPPPRPWPRGWPLGPETLVVNYHNITPPELMAPWDNHLALGQLRAQGDLRLLAPRAALAVADSAYNEAHLAGGGLRRHGGDPAVGGPRRRRHRGDPCHDGGLVPAGRGRRPLAGRRDGCRPTRRSSAPSPRWPWPGRTATPRRPCSIVGKPATDSYVAALHRYVAELGLARAVALRRPRERRHGRVGVRRGRRAGRHVRARGLLRAGGRGHGGRTPGRGVRPGGGARGARRCRRRSCPTRTPTRSRPPSTRLLGDAAGREATVEAGRRRLAELDLDTAADRFVSLLAPLAEGSCRAVTGGIHQFVPMLHRGDAVGRHTLRLRDVMARTGHPLADLRRDGRSRHGRRDTTVPQLPPRGRAGRRARLPVRDGVGLAASLQERSEPLVVNYHNVTPPEYYAPWDNAMARHQLRAQSELRALAPRTALGLAVSAFNEAELRAAGFARDRGRPTRRHRAHGRGRPSAGPPHLRPRRRTPAPAGSAWGASPPTRRSSTRRWRSSSPGEHARSGGDARGGGASGRAGLHRGPAPLRRRDRPPRRRDLPRGAERRRAGPRARPPPTCSC